MFNGTVTATSYADPTATVHAVVGMAGDVEQLTHTFTQVRRLARRRREKREREGASERAHERESSMNKGRMGAIDSTLPPGSPDFPLLRSQVAPEWSAKREAKLGYARLHFASAHEMTFDFVAASDGSVVDSFTISRSAVGESAAATGAAVAGSVEQSA